MPWWYKVYPWWELLILNWNLSARRHKLWESHDILVQSHRLSWSSYGDVIFLIVILNDCTWIYIQNFWVSCNKLHGYTSMDVYDCTWIYIQNLWVSCNKLPSYYHSPTTYHFSEGFWFVCSFSFCLKILTLKPNLLNYCEKNLAARSMPLWAIKWHLWRVSHKVE